MNIEQSLKHKEEGNKLFKSKELDKDMENDLNIDEITPIISIK